MKVRLFIIFAALLLLAQPGFAQSAKESVASLTYLTEEFKPYNYQEEGEAKGLAVDLLTLVWQELKVTEQPIEFMPWPRAYQMVSTEPDTVLFAMLRSPEREESFKWAGPIALSHTYFWALASSRLTLDTIEDAEGLRVGVIKKYASAHLIQKHKDIVKIDVLGTIDMGIEMLQSRRIDLISFEERAFKRSLALRGLSIDKFKKVYLFHEARSYFAFSKSTPDSVISAFQKACDKVRATDQFKTLEAEYLQ